MRTMVLFLAVGLAVSACGDGSSTEEVGAARVLPPPDVVEPSEAEASGSVATPEMIDTACNELLGLTVGPEAEALFDMSPEEAQRRSRLAFVPFGDEAVAAFDALIDIGADPSNARVHEIVSSLDAVTLEPCGWPYFGAIMAINDTGSIMECSVEGVINDAEGVVEQVGERECSDEGLSLPDVLPCFEPNDVDMASPWSIVHPWTTVDCTTGAPVVWNRTDNYWQS